MRLNAAEQKFAIHEVARNERTGLCHFAFSRFQSEIPSRRSRNSIRSCSPTPSPMEIMKSGLHTTSTWLARDQRIGWLQWQLVICPHFTARMRTQVVPKGIAMKVTRSFFVLALALVLTLALMTLPASAADKPVKVYVLSGQSNMVGIGQVTGGGSRWGSEFIAPVLSVYPGKYDPDADYEKMAPTKTLKLESFGGVKPSSPSAATRASIQSFRATC